MDTLEQQIEEASEKVDRLARELVERKANGEACMDILVAMLELQLKLKTLNMAVELWQ